MTKAADERKETVNDVRVELHSVVRDLRRVLNRIERMIDEDEGGPDGG